MVGAVQERELHLLFMSGEEAQSAPSSALARRHVEAAEHQSAGCGAAELERQSIGIARAAE